MSQLTSEPKAQDVSTSQVTPPKGPLFNFNPDIEKHGSVVSSSLRPTAPVVTKLQTFRFFPCLPLELREMVWSLEACRPRVVEIRFYQAKLKSRNETRNTSKTLVPAILHVCTESRAAGLKRYDRLCPSGRFTGTYINWEYDYVSFVCSWYEFYKFRIAQLKQDDSKRSELVRNCRRLLLGSDLFTLRPQLLQLFKWAEEVVILDPYANPSEANGGLGNITLAPIDSIDTSGRSERDMIYLQRTWENVLALKGENFKKGYVVKALRGKERPLSRHEKAERRERERLESMQPLKPRKISFQNWRICEMKVEAENRGLSSQGCKMELVLRLQADEGPRHAQAMEEYAEAMKEHMIIMKKKNDAKMKC